MINTTLLFCIRSRTAFTTASSPALPHAVRFAGPLAGPGRAAARAAVAGIFPAARGGAGHRPPPVPAGRFPRPLNPPPAPLSAFPSPPALSGVANSPVDQPLPDLLYCPATTCVPRPRAALPMTTRTRPCTLRPNQSPPPRRPPPALPQLPHYTAKHPSPVPLQAHGHSPYPNTSD